MKLPKHLAGLTIQHNEHKNYYDSPDQWLADQNTGGCWFDWISDDEKQKAIEQDSIWIIQWYPHTPIGFNAIAASSIETLLEYVNENYPSESCN